MFHLRHHQDMLLVNVVFISMSLYFTFSFLAILILRLHAKEIDFILFSTKRTLNLLSTNELQTLSKSSFSCFSISLIALVGTWDMSHQHRKIYLRLQPKTCCWHKQEISMALKQNPMEHHVSQSWLSISIKNIHYERYDQDHWIIWSTKPTTLHFFNRLLQFIVSKAFIQQLGSFLVVNLLQNLKKDRQRIVKLFALNHLFSFMIDGNNYIFRCL